MPYQDPQISLPGACSLCQGSSVEKVLSVPDTPGTKSHIKLCGHLTGGLESAPASVTVSPKQRSLIASKI